MLNRLVLLMAPVWALLLAATPQSQAAPKATPKPAAKTAPAAPAKPKRVPPANPAPEDRAQPFPVENTGALPAVRASSVLVIDAQSGKILHEMNADQKRPVASTQKLLTALIVAEAGNLDSQVRVLPTDTQAEPTVLAFKSGEVYRRGDLLRVFLVHSCNDVARCLARDNAGSIEAFAERMNQRAAQLGMNDSRFVNPNGLPAANQYSTARDLGRLAMAAYRNRTIRSIVEIKEMPWVYNDGRQTTFKNTNKVLRNFPLCNGMKTGYTDAAGHCLISSASNNGRDVIVVCLGDTKDIWMDSYRLLNWGLNAIGGVTN